MGREGREGGVSPAKAISISAQSYSIFTHPLITLFPLFKGTVQKPQKRKSSAKGEPPRPLADFGWPKREQKFLSGKGGYPPPLADNGSPKIRRKLPFLP